MFPGSLSSLTRRICFQSANKLKMASGFELNRQLGGAFLNGTAPSAIAFRACYQNLEAEFWSQRGPLMLLVLSEFW
jgi:hypothetical protein